MLSKKEYFGGTACSLSSTSLEDMVLLYRLVVLEFIFSPVCLQTQNTVLNLLGAEVIDLDQEGPK